MPGSITYERAAHLIDPECVEAVNVLGPTIQFLTSPEETSAASSGADDPTGRVDSAA